MSYEAIVARIHTRPHPKADRLQLGSVCGHQVVVGLDTQDGELGVFFPTDGQLSEQMVQTNGLYSKSALDKLGLLYTENHKFGFFSERRRVRAQSFRGEKSDGFWCPISYFAWTDATRDDYMGGFLFSPKEGDTLTELNGWAICNKYETPATKHAQSNKIGRRQRENKCFPKHDVTQRYQYVSDKIPTDAVIYITEKLHGTSGRFGRVLDDQELPGWKSFLNAYLGCHFSPRREWTYLNGSKNVILEKTTGAGYYGTNDFRYKAIEHIMLRKGEVIYFEIVGDYEAGKPLMGAQPIKDELKDIRKQYGELMQYRYGQASGTCDIYVYKILYVNEDGEAYDASWQHVKQRCKELGLKHVPELGYVMPGLVNNDYWHEHITRTIEPLTEGSSTLDSSHIREGVVLRVESSEGIDYIKNKSFTFGVLEGYIKDSDSYVDTEEAS